MGMADGEKIPRGVGIVSGEETDSWMASGNGGLQ